jgi:hypothetical protein
MQQPEWKDSLLSVTEQLNINTLFMFFPYTISSDGDSLTWFKKDSLVSLLAWAKGHAFSVHAVAGEPEWALPRNHNRPQTFAREVITLRTEIGMPDGIQFDIEPYLLLPFSIPQTKQTLIRDWINVVWKIGKLVRRESSLIYGIAIPFWMEENLTVDNSTMAIGNHLSYLTDYLAVMAYRNKASGPASVISFSEQERKWAAQSRRKIYIGIETQRLGGSVSQYLCEVPSDTFTRMINDADGDYADFHIGERKISATTIDGKLLVGVSGSDIPVKELTEIRQRLMADFKGEEITIPYRRLQEFVFQSDEGETLFPIVLSDGTNVFGLRSEEQRRSSMYGLVKEDFLYEYSQLIKHARRYGEIEGVAVHDLKSVRKLLEQK